MLDHVCFAAKAAKPAEFLDSYECTEIIRPNLSTRVHVEGGVRPRLVHLLIWLLVCHFEHSFKHLHYPPFPHLVHCQLYHRPPLGNRQPQSFNRQLWSVYGKLPSTVNQSRDYRN